MTPMTPMTTTTTTTTTTTMTTAAAAAMLISLRPRARACVRACVRAWQVVCERVFAHAAGQVWGLAPCPVRASVMAPCPLLGRALPTPQMRHTIESA
eukprot:COSAG01_NODE_2248_length_8076_cov_919.568384_10_plen_97_part_00